MSVKCDPIIIRDTITITQYVVNGPLEYKGFSDPEDENNSYFEANVFIKQLQEDYTFTVCGPGRDKILVKLLDVDSGIRSPKYFKKNGRDCVSYTLWSEDVQSVHEILSFASSDSDKKN